MGTRRSVMADYGVYFEIVNTLGTPMKFLKFESGERECCRYDDTSTIPSDGSPRRVHLADPCSASGAPDTAYVFAVVGGQVHHYAWSGDCPVWSPYNHASGPGMGH